MQLSDRRTFLRNAAVLAGAFPVANAFSATSHFELSHGADFASASAAIDHLTPAEDAQNEDFWSVIQRSYSVNPDIVNLNNGGVSPSPIVVQ